MFTQVQERIINAYVTLIMADRRTIQEAPEELREEIQIRIAEKELEVLTQ